MLDKDRELLLSDELDRIRARPEIIQSWRRCHMSGVDPDRLELRYKAPTGEVRLARCAVPLLSTMAETMIGARTSLLLTDRCGRLIWRWSEDTDLGRELDRKSVVEGTHWDETAVGTGGVGTSLETMRPLTVTGAEHYVGDLHPFTCVAAPIRHPITRRVEGVLNITCLVADFHPLMKPTLLKLIREVESELFGDSSMRDRQLFKHFLGERRRLRAAVVAVNDDIVIANRSAERLDVDPKGWWARAGDQLDGRGELVVQADRDGRSVELRQIVEAGTAIGLMIVVEESRGRPPESTTVLGSAAGRTLPAGGGPRLAAGPTAGPNTEPAAGPNTGRAARAFGHSEATAGGGGGRRPRLDAPLWSDVVASALRVGAAGEPVLVTGEPGSGKTTLLRRLGGDRLAVHDAATLAVGGRHDWFAAARRLLEAADGVAITHLETLDPAAAAAVTAFLRSEAERGRALVGATWTDMPDALSGTDLGLCSLFNVETVEVPPLRERPEDIEPLLRSLLEREPHGGELHLTPAAVDLLRRHRWTGNVSELCGLVRWLDRQPLRVIDAGDLPQKFRVERSRRRLSPMEAAEAELIMKALERCDGNKVLAAATLGIARSSLYRKIRAYRLDA